MTTGKKLVVGAVLLALLGLGALAGVGVPGGPPGSAVPVARADGCEGGNPPPPGLDCPAPTPTPTPDRGG
jgi:hypothetical protein